MSCRLLTLLLLACCCHLAASQAGAADLENRELRVVTITQKPFVMRVEDSDPVRYEGFYIDLLNLLQRELKFRYRIYEVADSKFGSRSPKGVWNGLMGDIVNKTADLTLATLRIMPKRLEAVDFTLPISSSGLSLLYKEAASQTSQAALLLQPFDASTWVLLLLVYIIYLGLAFVLFLLSPYELGGSAGSASSTVAKARKAGCGAFAFITGGLFIQGFARTPKAPSARALAFAWWLFALATACCYTAGLATRLMAGRPTASAKFGSLQELMAQSKVPYGVLAGGSTATMLANSNIPEFLAVNAFLSRNPSWNVKSTEDGLQRVRKGGYVWIAEGITADHHGMTECELVSSPTGLATVDIGLAIAKGSNLKQAFDAAILKVKANGELDSMKSRWWRKNDDQCAAKASDWPSPLAPGDLLGLYLVLLLGCLAAFVALPLEFMLKAAGLPSCGRGQQAEQPAAAAAAAQDKPGEDAGAAATAGSEEKQPEPESKPLV
ncbi:hypothetical protein BOX15_Mlig007793g1 [Macrostomum lignano]|uniref:Glutamate receptor n=1 Tax=Macrostomum lignano TaxID=282301 RepID=A0A267GTS9_9PLAT|nr:hypothetical protein BOX15_Mlig007793g1 [Macrostomum lignano]